MQRRVVERTHFAQYVYEMLVSGQSCFIMELLTNRGMYTSYFRLRSIAQVLHLTKESSRRASFGRGGRRSLAEILSSIFFDCLIRGAPKEAPE